MQLHLIKKRNTQPISSVYFQSVLKNRSQNTAYFQSVLLEISFRIQHIFSQSK